MVFTCSETSKNFKIFNIQVDVIKGIVAAAGSKAGAAIVVTRAYKAIPIPKLSCHNFDPVAGFKVILS